MLISVHSMAEKYGRKYIKEFASRMERQLGMKVLVLSGHLDIKGSTSVSLYVLEFAFI
jgi:hypothetical protein